VSFEYATESSCIQYERCTSTSRTLTEGQMVNKKLIATELFDRSKNKNDFFIQNYYWIQKYLQFYIHRIHQIFIKYCIMRLLAISDTTT
jgi:hypothetical protein